MAARKATAQKAKAVSRSERAGLQFPVGRIARFLKQGKYAGKQIFSIFQRICHILQDCRKRCSCKHICWLRAVLTCGSADSIADMPSPA